jgi:RNA polymerase sigma-70 factor (ECF subfamily)
MDAIRSLLITEIPHLRRYARVLSREAQAAEDLVQSCLERALSRLHQWDRNRRLRPWLLTIMHNLHTDSLRRRAAAPPMEPLTELTSPAEPARQDVKLEARQVLEAAALLPEEQRQAVLLVAVEELSYQEAAEVLGIPAGTFMSRLHRGRERLREILKMKPQSPSLRRVK